MTMITVTFPDAISGGAHASPESGACIMEMVALFAGEPFSDRPACACPFITDLAMYMNDVMPNDTTRTRVLGPLVSLIAGSRASDAVKYQRAAYAHAWVVRALLKEANTPEALYQYGDGFPVGPPTTAEDFAGAADLIADVAVDLLMFSGDWDAGAALIRALCEIREVRDAAEEGA